VNAPAATTSFPSSVSAAAQGRARAGFCAPTWLLGPPSPASTQAAAVGTTFSFELNQAASVTCVFTRSTPKHSTVAGAIKLAAHKGSDKLQFTGVLAPKKELKPGSYKVTITAVNAEHQRSAARSLAVAHLHVRQVSPQIEFVPGRRAGVVRHDRPTPA